MTVSSAVVLAAGEGIRLRPLTKHRPKPMLPAGNRPILEYVLDALVDAGIDDLHLVVGYGANRVQNHFGSTYRDRLLTYHRQETQLGSGHALLQAKDALDADFCVVNGDQLIESEMVRAVLDAHTVEDVATLGVLKSEQAPNYGAVAVEDGRVVEFVERPATRDYHLLNAGIYVFAPSFLPKVETAPRQDGELALSDPIASLIDDDSPVRAAHVDGIWQDATYPWDLRSLTETVLSRGLVDESPVEDGVFVADTASIHEDATLRAPVVIGTDCVVGPNAVIGPGTALGANVTVDAGAVVSQSVIDADCRIGINATVVECVAARGVHIDAGATIPGGRASVVVGTTVHEDVDLGGVLADRVRLGAGTTVEPGTLIGSNARIAAGCTVDKAVDEGTEVRR